MSQLRNIPAVEKVLKALGDTDLPRPLVVDIVREAIAELREAGEAPEFDVVVEDIRSRLDQIWGQRLQPVINGTGVLIHTNLGRSPLSAPAVENLQQIASNYNNLEFDIPSGDRGKRAGFLERCLASVTNAEAATVVNNCASALVLILRYFVKEGRDKVIISRGELVEIGGGFRIPDILLASGAKLHEVGATNKTTLADYEDAIADDTAMILKVHQSNFFMGGFVENPTTEEISAMAREKGVPFVEDLGSGAVINTDDYAPIEHEPTPQEIFKKGVDLLCFSGDKLLGGPQAGIIAGNAELVAGIKKEPFYRALRCDKLILSLLEITAVQYLNGDDNLPLLTMLALKEDELRARAEKIYDVLSDCQGVKVHIGEGLSRIGGGTMPKSTMPSVTLDLEPVGQSLNKLARRLRLGAIPVITYTSDSRLKIDLRTVFPRQDSQLADSILAVSK
ncbi:MAG: L-seryl-tRNA(Ser) seleniumtransferase [Verrucomicrobiales bacterium]|jgi:L-seryl-tRNA(Ser) seleniumtransferase